MEIETETIISKLTKENSLSKVPLQLSSVSWLYQLICVTARQDVAIPIAHHQYNSNKTHCNKRNNIPDRNTVGIT
jgi:hypothetical protein